MRTTRHFRERAFTLVEVVLAILIICGIMTVLLYFYQRAAEVRQTTLEETEFISVGRLLMEQITSELRTARVVEEQFLALDGSSNSIRFVCTTLPAITRWLVDTNDPSPGAGATDLKEVYYGLATGTNVAQVLGIERREKPVLAPLLTGYETNLVETTNEAGFFLETPSTNAPSPYLTNSAVALTQPLTTKVKFLQFRYWDGAEWVESWSGLELPAGVEISIGREAMPEENQLEGYPYELFRRVVFIPQGIHPANRELESPGEEVVEP